MGFCVVMIDNRGAANRGVNLEAGHLKYRLGQVELLDQEYGLRYCAQKYDCIDLDRVAILGWSYGGYLALMALAQMPNLIKIAIAGAPVVSWRLYNTGYTERYLGLPSENEEQYLASNVLNYVSSFPTEENRLMIIHGLNDENVHFAHTKTLINKCVQERKPYILKVYPSERHGFRNIDSMEHFEVTLLLHLLKYL
ncbi:unnamed protein product [Didymodactylos carnosus]|uniref:Peptidase S9 prolyl oligopeptidase catalytic domain-containing protein n=2 Tax=Didymodactylos carnosus TaxID=1234261 RepID=A0A814J6U5_9BILA|nr:unnamed protein product [Didymodactylos carnosus]CAF3804811.1 unnamed protein product [Didymodactylos carnosus]